LDLRTWPRYHLGVFKGFENKLIFLEISTGWNNSFKIGSFYFTWNRILFLSKYFLSKGFEGFAQRIWLKLFLYSLYFKYGSKCSNSQVSKRQEINLIFKIKVFVGSKIWYFNNSIYFYFPKIWVVTTGDWHDKKTLNRCMRWLTSTSYATSTGWSIPSGGAAWTNPLRLSTQGVVPWLLCLKWTTTCSQRHWWMAEAPLTSSTSTPFGLRLLESMIEPTGCMFHGIVHGRKAFPIGKVTLPVTFSTP
jgi:hypothetical protein